MVQLGFLLLQVAPLLAFGRVAPFAQDEQLVRRAPPTCTFQPVTPPGPPPRGFYCNKQGTIKKPAVLTSRPQPSLEACRDSCLNGQAGCISFSYGPNKRCFTYSKNIVEQGFTAGQTGRAFYNRKCFTQVCSCPSSLTNCNNDCVDTQTDENNCGACGQAVASGDSCCSGADTNTQTDNANCGACGQAVAEGETCCSGQATDTTSDENNCGACGQPVSEGNSCCNSQSVDTQSDPANCGACGNAIQENQTCCSGQAVDLSSDSNNCGACGNQVSGTCCNGQGVDTSSDPNNCGSCGNVVQSGQSCCNGQALDTSSDPNNCGACGNVCGGNICYKGVCPSCSGDFCSQGAGTPCGSAGNCNCVGIEGSTQYGVCSDVNDGTSCSTFQPSCNTSADCPSGSFCGNYQIACNCGRNACFPKSSRCVNTFFAGRIFRPQVAQAGPGELSAKGSTA